MTQSLPTSDTLATMLSDAAETAASLQAKYFEAWNSSRTARINRDLVYDDVVARAYIDGAVDGKNAEVRKAQLDAFVNGNLRLTDYEATLRAAEAALKRSEGLLEAARTHRSALHDMVQIRRP